MSEPKVIGYIKRNNGIRGPGFAEWQEPVYEVSPSPDAGTGTPTPETDAAQSKARVGHQAMVDKDWPWSAINEGWDFARSLESRLTAAMAALREIEAVPIVAFSPSKLEIADRTIERMRQIARDMRQIARDADRAANRRAGSEL